MSNKISTTDNSSKINDIYISKETIKRLIKDVKDIRKNPLEDDGIYYKHDDTNFTKGYAMIIGSKDSIYFGGYYFFYFDFPHDYPYSPPKLSYSTNDGVTRFHPNLYKNGKVCLSILNTWRGESWSSCQTIRSILLTLLTILDDKPLLHEPGFSEKSSDFPRYNNLIMYKNVEFSILRAISKNSEQYFPKLLLELFSDEIKNTFEKNKTLIYEKIKKYENDDECTYNVGCYRMNQTINWSKICLLFKKEYIK
jgi:ubiquitin-conjugating enzyme E2 Z